MLAHKPGESSDDDKSTSSGNRLRSALRGIAKEMGASSDENAILEIVCRRLWEAIPSAEMLAVMYLNPQHGMVTIRRHELRPQPSLSRQTKPPDLQPLLLPTNPYTASESALRTSALWSDTSNRPDFVARALANTGYVVGARAPLNVAGVCLGALVVGSRKARSITLIDLTALQEVADHAAIALSNAQQRASQNALLEDLQTAYERLQALDRVKDEFVSLASHELRTPLHAIIGYTEILLDNDGPPMSDEQREYLELIKSNAGRLGALVNNLLDLSRIDAGGLTMDLQELDLRKVISDAVDALKPHILYQQLHLDITLADEPLYVQGDPQRLIQIVTNLLSNALKYTPPEGHIYLTSKRVGSSVQTDLTDTGIGLTLEEQARLFTRFFRADNETTRRVKGTGLGLAITKALVEQHGGHIWAVSEQGKGSTFTFTIPYIESYP